MGAQIELGDTCVEVVRKNIKNLHLSVHPPSGRVTIAAPERMELDAIRLFAITKLGWIKRQQQKLREQERETPREYLERESHYVWGKRYLLRIVEHDAPPSIELKHNKLVLSVRPGTDEEKRESLLEHWYRTLIKDATPALLDKWEPIIGVKVERLFVQRMKTKWGSCNHQARHVRLNTDLAKKPKDCLEYILVHEMAHIREPTHNARFVDLMDRVLPHWRNCRDMLNQLPVRQENWKY